MNCQDITRLVDSGKFSAVAAEERSAAEAHALSCQRCAPLWIMHASVAATLVPATPAELSVRCLTVATAASGAVARQSSRRLMVTVGSLLVLAAAASMLIVKVANAPAPQSMGAPVVSAPAYTAATTEPAVAVQDKSDSAAEQALPADTQELPASNTQRGIPLFPPQNAADQAFANRREMALAKLVELHPEVTQTLPDGMIYDATILLRADGKVLAHSMRTITRETLRLERGELSKTLPNDGGETFHDYASKGTQLADGRSLGADLSFGHLLVKNTYDLARSNLRVDEIMRAQRAELMLPPTETGGSHVTVLLSGAGAIQREVARFISGAEVQEQENWSAADRAQAMARVLGISKDEIGLMGSVPVYDNETRRAMFVDYAWQRLPGESEPRYRQIGWDRYGQEGIDTAAALAVVERVMPDAFMGVEVERALGIPCILLTEEGEFIRTARVKASDPRNAFPGTSIATFRGLVLKNGKGATSFVYFLWQGTSPPK
jgi:hypothetical protein